MRADKIRPGMSCIPTGGSESDRQTVVEVEGLQGGQLLITICERGRARWWRTSRTAEIGGTWSR